MSQYRWITIDFTDFPACRICDYRASFLDSNLASSRRSVGGAARKRRAKTKKPGEWNEALASSPPPPLPPQRCDSTRTDLGNKKSKPKRILKHTHQISREETQMHFAHAKSKSTRFSFTLQSWKWRVPRYQKIRQARERSATKEKDPYFTCWDGKVCFALNI